MKYEHELEVARAAAVRAGEVVSASYSRIGESDVDQKGRNDYVTVVDHRSQQIIVDAIRAAFPKDTIVAEETLASVSSATMVSFGNAARMASTMICCDLWSTTVT